MNQDVSDFVCLHGLCVHEYLRTHVCAPLSICVSASLCVGLFTFVSCVSDFCIYCTCIFCICIVGNFLSKCYRNSDFSRLNVKK